MIHTSIVFHLVLKTNKLSLTLCPGLPRSGTTSLWKMLSGKFFDIPCKEPHFLTVLSKDKTDSPTFFPKEYKERYHHYVYESNKQYININPPYSLELYKTYIKNYSYDFSQSYWYIAEDYLREVKKSLSDVDIKVILLYRDPVQRLFSLCNLLHHNWNLDISPIELYYLSLDRDDTINLYTNLFQKYKNVFQKVICLKTESFFNSLEEQQKLLKYLDLPSSNLKSVYVNESNVCNQLSDEDMAVGRQKLKPSYDFYHSL